MSNFHKIRKLPVKGLVTLITGSASSLGTHVRQRLAINGSKILALDINHKTIVEEDDQLKSKVSFITGDVTDEPFLENLFLKYNKIDAIVNCAAVKRAYNYFTSYLVSKHALNVMQNNEINSMGCRGCVINVIGLKTKYDEKYFEEQDFIAKKLNITDDTIDEKVMELAEQLTAARIRCNTIIVPEKSDLKRFSDLILNVIEDQYIAGQIINMEDEEKLFLGSFKDIWSEYHVPPDPKKRAKLSATQQDSPVLRLGTIKTDK